jgi:N-acetylglutamate synthase-like GNAT family acetyltransferase
MERSENESLHETAIRRCEADDVREVCAVINDGASAYRGVIAPDRWKEPYMPLDELRHEIEEGVVFWCIEEDGRMAAVMGLQPVQDVLLVRHAYTRTERRGSGLGTALLTHLQALAERPMLIGTWKAATWAIAFYERRGFRMVSDEEKNQLLRRYWTIPERQIEESVVLADARWAGR